MWLKSLHVITNVKAFSKQHGQPGGQPDTTVTQIHNDNTDKGQKWMKNFSNKNPYVSAEQGGLVSSIHHYTDPNVAHMIQIHRWNFWKLKIRKTRPGSRGWKGPSERQARSPRLKTDFSFLTACGGSFWQKSYRKRNDSFGEGRGRRGWNFKLRFSESGIPSWGGKVSPCKLKSKLERRKKQKEK